VVAGPKLRAMRARMGMVFQHFNLFTHMSVLGNVIEAPMQVLKLPRDQAEARGRELLARVGLADKCDAYPSQLSGGQKQRVAIARSLAMEPKLLLLDEITSALDPELVGEVLQVIRTLAKQGMTMLIVTHEMGFAREVADRVIFMDGGRIVETGPPDALFVRPQSDRLRQFLRAVLDRAPLESAKA
jgi:ABC-type polar amino acid transport system ATPase subunit